MLTSIQIGQALNDRMKANLLIGVWVVVGSDVVDVILPITKVKGINECLF